MTEAKRNEHLIFAILSMDAYHRSNGGGLAGYFGAGLTGQFDSYGHKVSSDQRLQDNYGFRAESYQHQDGKVVIAYRGTDEGGAKILKSTPGNTHSYGIAFGRTDTAQGAAAIDFYRSVQQSAYGANPSLA